MRYYLVILLILASCINDSINKSDENHNTLSNSKTLNIYNDVVLEMLYFPYRSTFDTSRTLSGISTDRMKEEFPKEYEKFKKRLDKLSDIDVFIDFSDTVWTKLDTIYLSCFNKIGEIENEFKLLSEQFVKLSKYENDSLIDGKLLRSKFENELVSKTNQIKFYLSHVVVSGDKAIFAVKSKITNHKRSKKHTKNFENYLRIYLLKFSQKNSKWYVYNARECVGGSLGIFEF